MKRCECCDGLNNNKHCSAKCRRLAWWRKKRREVVRHNAAATMDRMCARCFRVKGLQNFINYPKPSVICHSCRDRNHQISTSYVKRNKVKVVKKHKAWIFKHRVYMRKYWREYYRKNRLRLASKARTRYRENNYWPTQQAQDRRRYRRNPIRYRALKAASRRRVSATLKDSYVRGLLVQGQTRALRRGDFPPELVEMKRKHIKLHRALREL